MWLVTVTGLAFLAGLAGGLGMALLAAGLVALVWIGLVSLFRRQVVPSPHVSNKALAGVAAATLVGGARHAAGVFGLFVHAVSRIVAVARAARGLALITSS